MSEISLRAARTCKKFGISLRAKILNNSSIKNTLQKKLPSSVESTGRHNYWFLYCRCGQKRGLPRSTRELRDVYAAESNQHEKINSFWRDDIARCFLTAPAGLQTTSRSWFGDDGRKLLNYAVKRRLCPGLAGVQQAELQASSQTVELPAVRTNRKTGLCCAAAPASEPVERLIQAKSEPGLSGAD